MQLMLERNIFSWGVFKAPLPPHPLSDLAFYLQLILKLPRVTYVQQITKKLISVFYLQPIEIHVYRSRCKFIYKFNIQVYLFVQVFLAGKKHIDLVFFSYFQSLF